MTNGTGKNQKIAINSNQLPLEIIAGIDEVGRGCIAGPVVASCLILTKKPCAGIKDSKQLSRPQRQAVFNELQNCSLFGIGIVKEEIIDQINILEATKLAMLRAYHDLCAKHKIYPTKILVDGNFVPFAPQDKIKSIKPIIKGDQLEISIAAASIIAKIIRDKIMFDWHEKLPLYGFANHVGYPTKSHLEAIRKFGILTIHRKSFEPIKSMLLK